MTERGESTWLNSVDLADMATSVRRSIIEMLLEAGSGHSAGALGMADMLVTLYFRVMRHDPQDPEWDERDLFVLSNGHVAPVLYATLAHAGYLELAELSTLRKYGSRLQGHPERHSLPGVETTSGPLGSGLSQAAGMAYALQYLEHNPRRFVYVAMGDGELNEGNIWEAAMFAGKNRLGKLIGIVDRNFIQIDGQTEDVMPLDDLRAKFESFGWHVLEVDGNNTQMLSEALATAKAVAQQPSILIAYTVPGKGVPFMEYDFRWHGKAPNKDEAAIALQALARKGH